MSEQLQGAAKKPRMYAIDFFVDNSAVQASDPYSIEYEQQAVEINKVEVPHDMGKQCDSGLSYFHLLHGNEWFPFGTTTNHKVKMRVAKKSVKASTAGPMGPVVFKVRREDGSYEYIGGDDHNGINDDRYAELICHHRLERTINNVKTGHQFNTAQDKLVLRIGQSDEAAVPLNYVNDGHSMMIEPCTPSEVRKHFPEMSERYSIALANEEPEHDAHPETVMNDITCEVKLFYRASNGR
jgi:hypothetical protein